MSDAIYNERIKALAAEAARLMRIEAADCTREEDNFLCGDRMALDVDRRDGRVLAIGGRVRGCLLVQAAAALIARRAPGLGDGELVQVIAEVEHLLTSADGAGPGAPSWDELAMFAPVRDHKHRHDCVLLPFRALGACLDRAEDG